MYYNPMTLLTHPITTTAPVRRCAWAVDATAVLLFRTILFPVAKTRVQKQDYKTPEVIKMYLAKGLLFTVICILQRLICHVWHKYGGS